MRQILESSPLGVAVLAPDSLACRFVNKSLINMFGAASAAELQAHLASANGTASWHLAETCERYRTRLLAGGNLSEFDATRCRLDGTRFQVRLTSVSIEFDGTPSILVWHDNKDETRSAPLAGAATQADLEERVRERTRALEQSAFRLRHISEVASDWFWEMGPDLRFTYFSNRVMEVVGFPADFHIGKTRQELAGEDSTTPKWKKHFQDLEDRKAFRDFRYERIGLDGKVQVLTTSGKPVYDDDGKFLGYIGIGADITKQVEADEKLKRADERLAAAVHAFSEPFILWGSDDRLLIANQTAQKVNKPLAEKFRPGVLYREFADALVAFGMVPEAVGREQEWLDQRLEMHRNPQGPFEQMRQDGLWFLIYEQRLADGCTVTISTDITRLKQTEARLKESQERFRDFADVAAEWYWEQDADLRFIDINAEGTDLTQGPIDEIVGKRRWETGLTDISDAAMADHKKLLEARKPFYDFRAARLGADNVKRHLSISGKPIFDDQGKFAGYRGSGRDITDMVTAQKAIIEERDRAERANRAKTEFLANMSHELRTPLNSIIGYSQMIKDQLIGQLGNPKYAEYATDIFASGQHLLMVISDILDISKVEAGEIELEESDVDIRETVEASLLIIQLLVQSKDQKISLDIPAKTPRLRVDDRLVRQILINLLSNAVKFTPDEGVISVQAERVDGDGVRIRVQDNGIGIEPADIEKALEPFGQVRSAPELVHEGTGLGLSLSKSLMELHGGSLSIESEVARGTTVTLAFPEARIV